MYIGKNERTLTEAEIKLLATQFTSGVYSDLSFQSKSNRDAVSAELRRRKVKHNRTRMSGQSIDPRYTVEGRHLPDKGLANDRIFVDLYEIS